MASLCVFAVKVLMCLCAVRIISRALSATLAKETPHTQTDRIYTSCVCVLNHANEKFTFTQLTHSKDEFVRLFFGSVIINVMPASSAEILL